MAAFAPARSVSSLMIAVCLIAPSFAQTGGTGGGSTGTGSGTGGGSTGTGGRTSTGVVQPQPQQRNQNLQRPMFIAGSVIMDDGSPVPHGISIERVCGSRTLREGYTDSTGHFSFQVGRESSVLQDASVFGGTTTNGVPSMSNISDVNSIMSESSGGNVSGEITLFGCELKASVAGYRSSQIDLSLHRSLDSPDVGTIVLQRLDRLVGTTVSVVSAQAPKEAKREYEKGLNDAKKSRLEDAQKHFEEAVRIYPRHAEAWLELGNVYTRLNQKQPARHAFEKAIEADPKYVRPLLYLAMLISDDRDWKRVAELTDRALELDPLDFPMGFFYNAVAHYNLSHLDIAEKSARRAKRLDGEQNRLPQVDLLLGRILTVKKDYPGALDNLRTYLKRNPKAEDVEDVRKQVAALEQMSTASAK